MDNQFFKGGKSMGENIYIDNAATTYVSGEVLNEMLPCFNTIYGNSNSIHKFGRDAAGIVDRARDRVAKAINAEKSNEIYFTSGGTEANNWALKGVARANLDKGNHIITSAIEHDSVFESCHALEKLGFEITYLPVNHNGLVDLADVMHYINQKTILISIMSVNNEIGTIQNIKAIAKTAHENGIIFHTDAVQAIGALKIDVQDMEIDLMSMSGHKIYGPKGVGALYIKNGIKIENLISGGKQERGMRGGTVNVPAVAGFGKAVEIAHRDLSVNQQKIKMIKNYFLEKVSERIPYIKLNGHPQQRVQGIVNLSFEIAEGESILMLLDLDGIYASTGSACAAGLSETSHVLKAIGLSDELARSSIRFSFGKTISKEKVDFVIDRLVEIVEKLRKISPLTKPKEQK